MVGRKPAPRHPPVAPPGLPVRISASLAGATLSNVRTVNALGDFLRARRAAVSPLDVGLPPGGLRRTPGLRREEVAALAGISTQYYVRLEQGRERSPSPQILDALVSVFGLDAPAINHMYLLAGRAPATLRPENDHEDVAPGLQRLLQMWTGQPAMVLDRWHNVLARNALAEALTSGFTITGNYVRTTFLDPVARSFHVDWHKAARAVAASLRATAGTAPNDPRLTRLVREVSAASPDFRRYWADHEIFEKGSDICGFSHPVVGSLELVVETFTVDRDPGQRLIVYYAEPGSPSADALALLGSVHAEPVSGEAGRRVGGTAHSAEFLSPWQKNGRQ